MEKEQTVKRIEDYVTKKKEIQKFEKTYLSNLKTISDNGSDLESPKPPQTEILT